MRYFFVVLVFIQLAGCTQLIGEQPSNGEAGTTPSIQVDLQRDEVRKTEKRQGPNCALKAGSVLLLRSLAMPGSPTLYTIYVMDHYFDDFWRRYETASDSEGHTLPMQVLERELGLCSAYGCAKNEHLDLSVTREYLMAHEDSGLRFQISGRGGSEVYFLPGGYISAFLRQSP